MIRQATFADLLPIEDLVLRLKRRTEFCTTKVDFERARKVARQCLQSGRGFAMVAEHDQRITGVLLGAIDRFWFSNERYASDILWFSQRRGDGDALFDRFKAWADARNARLFMTQSSGLHAKLLPSFYERRGLVQIGALYIGEKPICVPQLRSIEQ